MFRTIWLKTLRDYRFPIFIWGIGLGAYVLFDMVSFTLLGTDKAATIQFAQSFKFFGNPVAIDTPAGYATWDNINTIPIFLGIWTVIAGARIGRGDEDRHSSDIMYTLPFGRLRVAIEKISALLIALFVVAMLISLLLMWGQSLSATPINFSAAFLTALNGVLAAFVFGMIAFAIAQIVPRAATAAGIAGAILALSYLIEGTGYVITNGEWLQRFSPYYYFELSKPLIPSYGANPGAFVVQVILALFFLMIGVLLFLQRNIDDVAFSTHRMLPAISNRSHKQLVTSLQEFYTRTEGLRAFRANLQALCWWMLAIALYVGWMAALGHTTRDSLLKLFDSSPTMKQLLDLNGALSETAFTGSIVFIYLPVGLALFAMFNAMSWPNDLDDHRMEIPLVAPHARARFYWERVGAAMVGIVAMPIACGLAVAIAGYLTGMALDASKLVPSFLGLLPLEIITFGAIFVLSTWLRPNVISGLVGTLIGASFLAEFLNPIAKFPEWLMSLSIFHQFGKPYSNAPNWGSWLVMLLLAGIFLAVGSYRFSQNNIQA
jgi:ABC-2 type transport system permease protein